MNFSRLLSLCGTAWMILLTCSIILTSVNNTYASEPVKTSHSITPQGKDRVVADYFEPGKNDIILQNGTWNLGAVASKYPSDIENTSAGNSNIPSARFVKSSIIVGKDASLDISGLNLLLKTADYNNATTNVTSGGNSGDGMPARILVFGKVQIINSTIQSWANDTQSSDPNPFHPRPFLAALKGGSINITNSNLNSMGFTVSGLGAIAAVNYYDSRNFVIANSTLHDNYYGFYSQNASRFDILGNRIFNNTGYGLDPHTYSNNFTIVQNKIYSNGKQGIICSFHCSNFTMAYNDVENNTEGMGVHWLSKGAVVTNNTVRLNDNYGIFVSNESSGNVVVNNTVTANGYGIGILLHSTHNKVISNSLTNNGHNSVFLDSSSSGASSGNIVENNSIFNIQQMPRPAPTQPTPSSNLANFTDPQHNLEIKYPADWTKSNSSSNSTNSTLLSLTGPTGTIFSSYAFPSRISIVMLPIDPKLVSVNDLASFAIANATTQLKNIHVLGATPSTIDGRAGIVIDVMAVDSSGTPVKATYFCIINGSSATFFELLASPTSFEHDLPIAKEIVNTAKFGTTAKPTR